jgi:hypothetical protein
MTQKRRAVQEQMHRNVNWYSARIQQTTVAGAVTDPTALHGILEDRKFR